MVNDHWLTMPGKSRGSGIYRPAQRGHTNLYHRLLDFPVVCWLHVSEHVQLDVQMMLNQVLA
ncbi:hypothetical protein BLA6993_06337 [Burkholderia lata]|nr:hypothetical protein BLA6993_06337 [Burkholderia lata]